MEEAKTEISEHVTTFGEVAFTQDSARKDGMCFTLCLVVCLNDVIGYSIAYCLKNEIAEQVLNEYYLDTVFVNTNHRGKKISREIIRNLIESVINTDAVKVIKANTQDTNHVAQHLLESFGFGPKRPIF
jgi:ribosomal protein S18 acetylase RimI-like enzyme